MIVIKKYKLYYLHLKCLKIIHVIELFVVLKHYFILLNLMCFQFMYMIYLIIIYGNF